MKKIWVIIGLILLFLSIATLFMTLADPYTNILEGTLFFAIIGIIFLLAGILPEEK